jgi:hypothetical protein
MNMKSNNDNSAEDEFSALFEFDNKQELIDHKAHMFMFRCLSEVERITGENLSKKEISNLVETSPSYITQLFRGDKLINLLMLARFELALDSEFDIVLRKNSEKKTEIQFENKMSGFRSMRLLSQDPLIPLWRHRGNTLDYEIANAPKVKLSVA